MASWKDAYRGLPEPPASAMALMAARRARGYRRWWRWLPLSDPHDPDGVRITRELIFYGWHMRLLQETRRDGQWPLRVAYPDSVSDSEGWRIEDVLRFWADREAVAADPRDRWEQLLDEMNLVDRAREG